MQMHIRFFIYLPSIHLLDAIYSWVNLLLCKSASFYRSIESVSSSADNLPQQLYFCCLTVSQFVTKTRPMLKLVLAFKTVRNGSISGFLSPLISQDPMEQLCSAVQSKTKVQVGYKLWSGVCRGASNNHTFVMITDWLLSPYNIHLTSHHLNPVHPSSTTGIARRSL